MGEKTSEPVFAGKRKGEKDSTKQFEIKKSQRYEIGINPKPCERPTEVGSCAE